MDIKAIRAALASNHVQFKVTAGSSSTTVGAFPAALFPDGLDKVGDEDLETVMRGLFESALHVEAADIKVEVVGAKPAEPEPADE